MNDYVKIALLAGACGLAWGFALGFAYGVGMI